MRRLFTLIIFLFPILLFAQADTIRICGIIKDRTGDPIPFASTSIFVDQQLISGTVSDAEGYFSIQLNFDKDPISLCIQSFEKKKCFPMQLDTVSSTPYDFRLYTPYTKEQLEHIHQDAFKHIKKDQAIIYTFRNNFPLAKATKQHGYRYKYVSPIISRDCYFSTDDEKQLSYIKTFNQYSFDYLEKRNGKNWKELLHHMPDTEI